MSSILSLKLKHNTKNDNTEIIYPFLFTYEEAGGQEGKERDGG